MGATESSVCCTNHQATVDEIDVQHAVIAPCAPCIRTQSTDYDHTDSCQGCTEVEASDEFGDGFAPGLPVAASLSLRVKTGAEDSRELQRERCDGERLMTRPVIGESRGSSHDAFFQQQRTLLAQRYHCDPTDPIDRTVSEVVQAADERTAACVDVLRISPGQYCINDRLCQLYFDKLSHGSTLFVHDESGSDDGFNSDMPLPQYLEAAADTPPGEVPGEDADGSYESVKSRREMAMKLACSEAGLWEGEDPPPLVMNPRACTVTLKPCGMAPASMRMPAASGMQLGSVSMTPLYSSRPLVPAM